MNALKRLLPFSFRFAVRRKLNWLAHQRRSWLPLALRRPRAAAVVAYRTRQRPSTRGAQGIDRLDAILVINLAQRVDRLAGFMAQTDRLGIGALRRFDAIPDERGIVGCRQSHLACLSEMIERGSDCMMVCEDDARFLVSRAELDLLIDRFLDDSRAEVACLAYNQFRVEPHDSLFLRATETQTTACYMVKASIAPALASRWEEGLATMLGDESSRSGHLDIAWKGLQKERTFVIPIRRAARQEDGFSDIEQRVVRYNR